MTQPNKKIRINQLPSYKKPREKLLSIGRTNLTKQELLAIILGSGYKGHNVLTLADEILTRLPLHRLAKTKIKDLEKIKGIGVNQACKIIAALELGQRSQITPKSWQINSPQKIVNLMAELKNKQQEHCYALYINGRQELIEKKLLALGSFNSNILEARDIFVPALLLPCPFIILVHNHPSGDSQASPADYATSQKIKQAAEILGLSLLDHIIISKNNYFSFREHDQL